MALPGMGAKRRLRSLESLKDSIRGLGDIRNLLNFAHPNDVSSSAYGDCRGCCRRENAFVVRRPNGFGEKRLAREINKDRPFQ